MTVTLLNGRYQDVLGDRECDAIVTDPPYSARTHNGHNDGVDGFADGSTRKALDYVSWTPSDVRDAVTDWSVRCCGWIAVLTDTVLATAWADELPTMGRYVFSPIACVQPGRSVRRAGDGPAQWSVWLVVARPRSIPWCRYGALPGAYVVPAGHGRRDSIGGKPTWLMQSIVRDYSRVGDTVIDPCAGMATTLIACQRERRIGIGCEADPYVWERASERLMTTRRADAAE